MVNYRSMEVLQNLSNQHLLLEAANPSNETIESINGVFESILESEYCQIETMVTLSDPTAQLLPSLPSDVNKSDQNQWIGIERFIRPFEITYDYDTAECMNASETGNNNSMSAPTTTSPEMVAPAKNLMTVTTPVTVNIPAEITTSDRPLQISTETRSKSTVKNKSTSKKKKVKSPQSQRYDWTQFLDKQGILYTHTCSQLITKKRSTLSL